MSRGILGSYTGTARPEIGPAYPVELDYTEEWVRIGGVQLSWNDAAVAFDCYRDGQKRDSAMKEMFYQPTKKRGKAK